MYISISQRQHGQEQPPVVLLKDLCVKLNIKVQKLSGGDGEGISKAERTDSRYTRQMKRPGTFPTQVPAPRQLLLSADYCSLII